MTAVERDAVLRQVLTALAEKCDRLRRTCYWAGASAIALEELHHRGSFDLVFHTQKALADVRPILAEIQRDDLAAYPDVDPRAAAQVRDLLLGWLREEGGA